MKLDKSKVYSLEELTNEELKELWIYLTKVDEDWADCLFEEMIRHQKKYMLFFNTYNWSWRDSIESTANAKELFYTLKNVQVDCIELSEEQIKEMADVFKVNGLNVDTSELNCEIGCSFLQYLIDVKNVWVYTKDENKTTITYDKFMELFSKKKHPLTPVFDKAIEVAESINELKPKQYQIGIDAIDIAEKNMTKDECLAIARFNITKYSYRKKNQDLEDFKKVVAYANWAIKLLNK